MHVLRASAEHTGDDFDYGAITTGEGETGIPNGDLLIEFGEAVLGDDPGRLAAARSAIVDAMGAEALVDATGVAGLFNAIDRVADATGAPLEDDKAEQTAALRKEIGIDAFAEAKSALETETVS